MVLDYFLNAQIVKLYGVKIFGVNFVSKLIDNLIVIIWSNLAYFNDLLSTKVSENC